MFRGTTVLLLGISLASCAGPTAKPVPSYEEIVNFDQFAAIPLGKAKGALAASFGPFKTEISNPTTSEETYWIVRNPRTGYQKAALTFDERTQSLVAKVWIVNTGEPEQVPEFARARFGLARFVLKDLPSDNPHVLYGEKLLIDEKEGISIEIQRVRNEVSTIQWWNPAYRSPAQETGSNRARYTF